MNIELGFPSLDARRFEANAAAFQAEDGLVILPSVSTAEDDQTVNRLCRLNAVARAEGWRSAVERGMDSQGAVDYVTSESRLKFISLLPLRPDQHLLEIGVSLGQIAIPLAKEVRTFDGLEVVLEQARFCAERARQEGLENVRIIAGGADCWLPYPDAAFDGVVLNLVLEWCGNRDNEDHEAMQQRLLNEIARVLKPGGFFYLSTKNRYSLRLLLGGADEHMSQMRWGSALPRWLSRRLGGKHSQGRLHSYGHLKAMLRKAGLSRIDGYWAAPEMRMPTDFIPLETSKFRARVAQGGFARFNSRKGRLIMRMLPGSLVKYVTPGLTFLAYR